MVGFTPSTATATRCPAGRPRAIHHKKAQPPLDPANDLMGVTGFVLSMCWVYGMTQITFLSKKKHVRFNLI